MNVLACLLITEQNRIMLWHVRYNATIRPSHFSYQLNIFSSPSQRLLVKLNASVAVFWICFRVVCGSGSGHSLTSILSPNADPDPDRV